MITIKTFDQLSGREVFEIMKARQAVFIIEQTCIYPDMDELDLESVHLMLKKDVLLGGIQQGDMQQETSLSQIKEGQQGISQAQIKDEEELLAYLRILWKDQDQKMVQIGRVLTLERGKGYGTEILAAGVRYAKEVMKAEKIYLEAQEYAIGFYEREGFRVCSDVFLEDGIPHVKMML